MLRGSLTSAESKTDLICRRVYRWRRHNHRSPGVITLTDGDFYPRYYVRSSMFMPRSYSEISPGQRFNFEFRGSLHATNRFGLSAHTDTALAEVEALGMRLRKFTEEAISIRSVLYSFGVLAYEVLSGTHPFPGEDGNARIVAQLAGKVTSPAAVNSDIPTPVDGVLLQLLEAEPSVRFASARDVLSALSSALGLPVNEETSDTLDGYLRSSRLWGESALRACAGGEH